MSDSINPEAEDAPTSTSALAASAAVLAAVVDAVAEVSAAAAALPRERRPEVQRDSLVGELDRSLKRDQPEQALAVIGAWKRHWIAACETAAATFSPWLFDQGLRHDPVGHLGLEAAMDETWPLAGDLAVFDAYLTGCNALPEAHDALWDAWNQWERPRSERPRSSSQSARRDAGRDCR